MSVFISILIWLSIAVCFLGFGVLIKLMLSYRAYPIDFEDYPVITILFWPVMLVVCIFIELYELFIEIKKVISKK